MDIDIVPGTDYRIRQDRDKFSYGIDAILLSSFVKDNIKKKDNIIDLGTGTGIIPIRLSALVDFNNIYGVEIQNDVANMAKENIESNNLEDKIKIINDNIKNLDNYFGASSFDAIVSNPPYMKAGAAVINESENFAISRHEIECTFKDIVKISAYLLKPLGRFYLIHRPNRLVDIFYYMRKYNIEPKKIRMIQGNINKKASLVLVEGVMDGKPDLIIENPLIVYREDGSYTDEIYTIYGMEKGDIDG